MNIYFVCTGNTCRSPMAEAILKSMDIPNVYVQSAGIFALEGGEMSENAKAIIGKEGLELNHRSKVVTQGDINWADLVLTMTSAHKSMLLTSYPKAAGKVFTLKEYTAPYASRDVSDPFGGDLHQYQQTYQELKQHIEKLATLLNNEPNGEA